MMNATGVLFLPSASIIFGKGFDSTHLKVRSSRDRKSTRLNSSHTVISYAVFCLRTKKHTSELQSHSDIVCRLLLEKKRKYTNNSYNSRKNTLFQNAT